MHALPRLAYHPIYNTSAKTTEVTVYKQTENSKNRMLGMFYILVTRPPT